MEFKTIIVGVSYGDLKQMSPEHFFAEVILIDKTQEALGPVVYQLKKEAIYGNEDLASISKDHASLQAHAFMLVGEVTSIDKKKKMIYLSNGNVVSYNHLIVAAGGKPGFTGSEQEREFSDGLQVLIDALRMKKVPTAFSDPNQSLAPERKTKVANVSLFDASLVLPYAEIQKIVTHKMLKEANKPFSLSLNGTNKRLYEVIT